MRGSDQGHMVARHVVSGDGRGGIAIPAQVCVFPSGRDTLSELRPRAVHDLDSSQDGWVVDQLAERRVVDDTRLKVTGLEESDSSIDGTVRNVRDPVAGIEDLEQAFEARALGVR